MAYNFRHILILFFLSLNVSWIVSKRNFTCVHDLKIKEKKQVQGSESRKFPNGVFTLSSNDGSTKPYEIVRKMKIRFDDSALNCSESERMLIMKTLNVSASFLSKRLSIVTNGMPIVIEGDNCDEVPVNPKHNSTGAEDTDLMIYVTAKNEPNETFLAWALNCQKDAFTGRPTFGRINFNLNSLSFERSAFEDLVDTSLHEITHVLGFSSDLFNEFRSGFNSSELRGEKMVSKNITDVISQGNRTIITTPRVLEVARQYFSCGDISGVELENQGGDGSAGSHWERTVLFNEMMCANSVNNDAYSNFTLALLEDSGWYKVDYLHSEKLFFGKEAGCQFLDKRCVNQPGRREWCHEDKKDMCNFFYSSKSYCGKGDFSDACMFGFQYSDGKCNELKNKSNTNEDGETYGENSKCIVGNIISKNSELPQDRTLCYKYTCNRGSVTFFPAGGNPVTCWKEGLRVAAKGNFQGEIVCPDPREFCRDFYPTCPNYCSTNGYCVNGLCECVHGFYGDDCSLASEINDHGAQDS